MSEREFELYLSLLSKMLKLKPDQRASITDEMRDHLEERFSELHSQGRSRDDAIRIAPDEFGDAAAVAADFTHISKRKTRRVLMRFTLGSVVVTSLAIFLATAFWPEIPHGPAQVAANAQDQDPGGGPPVKQPKAAFKKSTLVNSVVSKPVSEVERKLEMPIKNISFIDQPLTEIIEYISEQIKVDILLDGKHLNDIGLQPDKAITLKLNSSKITARTVLELVLEIAGGEEVAIIERGELIYLTSRSRDYVTVVYNCRDLLDNASATYTAALKRRVPGAGQGFFSMSVAQLGGTTATKPKTKRKSNNPFGGSSGMAPGSTPGMGMPGGAMGGLDLNTKQSVAKALVNVIQLTVRSTPWREVDGDGATISVFNGLVVVSANHEAHREIKELLEMLRQASGKNANKKKQDQSLGKCR